MADGIFWIHSRGILNVKKKKLPVTRISGTAVMMSMVAQYMYLNKKNTKTQCHKNIKTQNNTRTMPLQESL
jgi:hypothetical protein